MALAAVRRAAPADVEHIVSIQSATWAAAYADLVPAAAITGLTSPEAKRAWQAAVAAGGVLVATEGAWTVGFVAAVRAGAPQGSPPDGEIVTLLVEPRWGRRGHGGRLLAAAATALRDRGARRGVAWVPAADAASCGFYARVGWAPDGAVRVLDTGDGTLREVRLTGSLELTVRE